MFDAFADTPAESGQLYARAAPRLQAYLRDFFVYMAIVVSCMLVAVAIGTPAATRALVVVCMLSVLLYEPLCVSLFGGTVGHLSLNLRIVTAEDLGPVSFRRALLRTVVKGVVGVWAFVAIYFTRRCQAVHDLAAGTVVIPGEGSRVSGTGFAMEKRRA
jgi:uncharacterized RDD family membrane protein YckC